MPPGARQKGWPRQREPSPVGGYQYPNQAPIVGVFGQQGFETVPVYSPGVLAQQKQITEQTQIQELPENHKRPLKEDVEIMAAEMLLHNKRSATDWKVITYTFDGTNPQQVGRMVGRVTIVFFNGTNNVTVARTVAGLAATANEQFIVTAGNSASIDTEGEFYMTAVANTTISVLHTFWDLEAMALAKIRTSREVRESPHWSGMKTSSNAN